MKNRAQEYLYPLIDLFISKKVGELASIDEPISCQKGCDHCCHLMVEVTWEEAEQLVNWLKQQTPDRQTQFIDKINRNAAATRQLFLSSAETQIFAEPVDDGELEIPEQAFDDYFYDEVRPCPFLEDHICAAYSHRPSACRLHLVSSVAELCQRDTNLDGDIETPACLDDLKNDLEPVLVEAIEDGRWGQLAIMVEAVLKEQDLKT